METATIVLSVILLVLLLVTCIAQQGRIIYLKDKIQDLKNEIKLWKEKLCQKEL